MFTMLTARVRDHYYSTEKYAVQNIFHFIAVIYLYNIVYNIS